MFLGGWMDGWVGGWVEVKAVLKIAYSNKKFGLICVKDETKSFKQQPVFAQIIFKKKTFNVACAMSF
jgi:hypothetical protein